MTTLRHDGVEPDRLMFSRLPKALVTLVLLSSASASYAQDASRHAVPPPAPVATERSIEDLNLLGAAVSNPPFTDTILGADSALTTTAYLILYL
jgi:hypothetical protein